MTDIAEGLEGVVGKPATVEMLQGQVTLSTGRPLVFAVPRDLTDAELLEALSWLAAPEGLRKVIRARTPLISLPGGMVLPPRG